jgi:hypothetical protein
MGGMTTTAYRLVPAPRFAQFTAYDCAVCEHEELAHPVFLDGPNGQFAAGTGCAAKLLGYPRATQVRKEWDSVQSRAEAHEEVLAERRERYGRALVAFKAGEQWNEDYRSVQKTYWQSGASEKLGSFPAWIVKVAETGELD